jgi:signal transduction histidine kinase
MIILKDITQLVQSEYLKTVEKVTDIMIASTSHDMRTPLNTVISMLKLIEARI